MRILIVEDEEKLARSLQIALEKEGYTVDYLLDGEIAERRLAMNHREYDLVILDLMLPKKSGIELCRELRAKNISIPIIVLTAKGDVHDKVTVLDMGADDYLVKPFVFEELASRIKALLRRPAQSLPVTLAVDDLMLNTSVRKVFRGKREVLLTLKEFSLLELFMRNAGKTLSREWIFDHNWDFASNPFSNVIDVHMKNLRGKIDNGQKKKLIESVRGIGYRLKGELKQNIPNSNGS